MALTVKNTQTLVTPENLRLVMMIYSIPGMGKSTFLGTADNIGIAACGETGHGSGLLPIAGKSIDYVEPANYAEVEEFCRGGAFKDKDVVAIDSLSAIARMFIKDEALKIPRTQGNSPKRDRGIPELDDYGTIGELTRKLLNLFFRSFAGKHLIVTATERYDRPGPNDPPGTESLTGPDLAGQMFLGSPAMFDFVFRLRGRPALHDPRDAKSKYTERLFLTASEGTGAIAKCRINRPGFSYMPLLAQEEVFNIEKGQGTFPMLLDKIKAGLEEKK